MTGAIITEGKGKNKVVKIKSGDFFFDIHNSYTADLFTRALNKNNINYTVSVNYDFGYRVIVPIYSIYGYNEVNKLLDYAIESTLDI